MADPSDVALETSDDPLYGRWAGFLNPSQPMHFYSYFQCPNCPRAPRVMTRRFEAYFEGFDLPCPTCNTPLPWWNVMKDWMGAAESFQVEPALPLLQLVGLRMSLINQDAVANSVCTIDLDEVGLPAGAIPVIASFEPHYGVEVSERLARGEVQLPLSPETRIFWTTKALSRRPLGRKLEATVRAHDDLASDVRLRIAWIDLTDKPDSWRILAEAILSFFHGDESSAIILANTACESELFNLLTAFYTRYVGREHAERMLQEGATYSHQLRVLIPSLSGSIGWPSLADDILSSLRSLNKLRNERVHGRKPNPDLSVAAGG